MDELSSLKRQLVQLKTNLMKIEFRKSVFIDPATIPLDLGEAERRVQAEIDRVEQRLIELGYNRDTLHRKPEELCTIPIIVAAMTREQADQLQSGKVFRNNPNVAPVMQDRFERFKQALEKRNIADLSIYYDTQREAWKLHLPVRKPNHDDQVPDEPKPIYQILFDVLDHINEHHRYPQNLSLISHEFLSNSFFSENPAERREVLARLRQSGGILIIDAISMFHPALSRRIYSSDIGSNKRVATLVFSPLDTGAFEINRLIEDVINLEWETAFTRFDYELDHLCEIGVGNMRALKRWLFAILPEIATHAQHHKPSPSNLEQLIQMRGEQPSGYGPADFMSWGGGQ